MEERRGGQGIEVRWLSIIYVSDNVRNRAERVGVYSIVLTLSEKNGLLVVW